MVYGKYIDMRGILRFLLGVVLWSICWASAGAQTISEAYSKYLSLTSVFRGSGAYGCWAIVEVSYEGSRRPSVRDSSRLIYRAGRTYYRSSRVERLEDSRGVLTLNHELGRATLEISDSLRERILEELDWKADPQREAMVDSNYEQHSMQAFEKYILGHCHYRWDRQGPVEAIRFWPRVAGQSPFESMELRFDAQRSEVVYYRYSVRDPYSRDWNGDPLYRLVTTIYDGFRYDQVPSIPYDLDDYLDWEGGTVRLKRYNNYQFSLL